MTNPTKHKLLLLLLILIAKCLFAQNPNPFRSIGKKAEIMDLSKGKYTEIIEKDSLERVGSVIVNRYTGRIEKFLDEAELKKFKVQSTGQSRFFSVDPIATKFPELSPYQYASNRPIDGKDLDGLEFVKFSEDPGYWITHFGQGWSEGKGGVYETVNWFNRNLNPFGILFYEGGAIITGRDPETGVKKNRMQATTDLGVNIMMYLSGEKLFTIFSAGNKLQKEAIVINLKNNTANTSAKAVENGIREQYTNAVKGLKETGDHLLSKGIDESYIARALNLARRKLGEYYKDITPPDLRDWIYKFNERRYGDKLGPTYEKLRAEGKTDKQIIESASRPLGDKDQLGSALYKEFGNEVKPVLEKYNMMPAKQ